MASAAPATEMREMRLLVVAAHPDDVELLAAGTLALLRREEHDIWLAHMTVGDKGGQQPPDELARIRGAEARRAAEFLGADVFGGVTGDLELYRCHDHTARVRELVTVVAPDVVFTHGLRDYHPDHRVTGQLVLDVVGAIEDQPTVVYMDNVAGIDFAPELYVDVTETLELKKEMLRCHESQVQWMASARHTDMEYLIEWLGAWRGLQCGARYAEGFSMDSTVGEPKAAHELLDALSLRPRGVRA
jgi:LmbE family N-acetylglucosaminyl deacetylase